MDWSDGGSGEVNAVRTTGIYCRAGCAGRPLAANTVRMRSPAEAEANGYRACLRCRSDRLPLVSVSPETDPTVAAAILLIAEGFLDHRDEEALGREVGMSPRHLRRLFAEAVGATPSQVASSRRAHFARALLDETDRSVTDIAFASGFGSVRSMNEVVRATFHAAPRELRRRRRAGSSTVDGGLQLTLRAHRPLVAGEVLDALAASAVAGVESVRNDTYRRSIAVCGHPGAIEIALPEPHTVAVRIHLPAITGLIDEIARVRRLLRLDEIAEPWQPGPWDRFEQAVRELVVGFAGDDADDVLARLARRGSALNGAASLGIDRVFPTRRELLSLRADPVDGVDRRLNEALVALAARTDGDEHDPRSPTG